MTTCHYRRVTKHQSLVARLEVLGSTSLGWLVTLLGVLGLWDEDRVDVWQNTTLGNGDTAEELVQLLVVADSQQDVARNDAVLLVVTGSVTSELKDLSGEVLKDGGEVDWSTSTDAGGILALLQEAANSANRELEASSGGLGLSLLAVSLATATLSTLTSTSSWSRSSSILWSHLC